MRVVITGGSGSGKSAFAEELVEKLPGQPRIYLATMQVFSKEDRKRVNRHRAMRKEKGFLTMERPMDIGKIAIPKNAVILLECMSNLLANELFRESVEEHAIKQKAEQTVEKICREITALEKRCNHLLLVTNEIGSDGICYSKEVQEYQKALGRLNCHLVNGADAFYEVVCGIPICHKDKQLLTGEDV